MQAPNNPALKMPVPIIVAARQDTQSLSNPQGSKMLSKREPYILNEPSTVPKENMRDRVFLLVNMLLIDSLKGVFYAIEPRLITSIVPWQSWRLFFEKHNNEECWQNTQKEIKQQQSEKTISNFIIRCIGVNKERRNKETNSSTNNINYSENCQCNRSLYNNLLTFRGINHRTAIFVGAFKMKGCAIAQKTCPRMTNQNDQFMRQRNPQPKVVSTAPITILFFIPFSSSTQFDGKFIKRYTAIQDKGIIETIPGETSQAQATCTEIGETITQHMPFTKDAKLNIATIKNLQLYSVSQSLSVAQLLLREPSIKESYLLFIYYNFTQYLYNLIIIYYMRKDQEAMLRMNFLIQAAKMYQNQCPQISSHFIYQFIQVAQKKMIRMQIMHFVEIKEQKEKSQKSSQNLKMTHFIHPYTCELNLDIISTQILIQIILIYIIKMQKKYKRCIGILIGVVLTGALIGIIFSIGRVPVGQYALNYDVITSNYSDNQVYGPGIYYIGIANKFLTISSLQSTLSFPNISAFSSDFYPINASLLVSYSLSNNTFDQVSNLYVQFGDSPAQILYPLIKNQIITTLSSHSSVDYQINISQIYSIIQGEIQGALTTTTKQWTDLQFNVLIASIKTEAAVLPNIDLTIDSLMRELINVKNEKIDFTNYFHVVKDKKMRQINLAATQMQQRLTEIEQLLLGTGQSNITNLLFNTMTFGTNLDYISALETLAKIGNISYPF